jgi:ABC-type cobalamin transport system ATPase subunit
MRVVNHVTATGEWRRCRVAWATIIVIPQAAQVG